MREDILKDSGFAARLRQACDASPDCPKGHGRNTWLKRRFEADSGGRVSLETVGKWLNGLARPRDDKALVLAGILSCDVGWLRFGDLSSAKAGELVMWETKMATGPMEVVEATAFWRGPERVGASGGDAGFWDAFFARPGIDIEAPADPPPAPEDNSW